MNCEHVREALADLGGGSAYRERLMVAVRHLDDCATCRAAVADYDRIATTLHESNPAEASAAWAVPECGWDAFESRLIATAAGQAPPRRIRQAASRPSRLRWLRRAGAIAACLCLAAGGYFAGRVTRPAVQAAHLPSTTVPSSNVMTAPTDIEVARQV